MDMDGKVLTALRNGSPIPGLVFRGLPDEVYVAATPFNKGSSVRIVGYRRLEGGGGGGVPPVLSAPVITGCAPPTYAAY